jgi:hypothetical protein
MQLSFAILMIFLFILQNIVCAVHYAKNPKCDKNCLRIIKNKRAIVQSNINLINVRLNLEKEKECVAYGPNTKECNILLHACDNWKYDYNTMPMDRNCTTYEIDKYILNFKIYYTKLEIDNQRLINFRDDIFNIFGLCFWLQQY